MFNVLLTIPLTNILTFLYNTIAFHDLGIAIILLVLLIKIVLFPLSKKGIESQAEMQKLQPKIKEIQNKYKGNKEEQNKALMEFWKKEKVNPMGGCLPMLIQFPIIIAIFEMFKEGLPKIEGAIYSFISNPGAFNPKFLGFIDLAAKNLVVLAIIAGILQYIQIKLTMPKNDSSAGAGAFNMKYMMLIFPVIGAYVVYIFPAALGIYWISFTLFSIGEHLIIKRTEKSKVKNNTNS